MRAVAAEAIGMDRTTLEHRCRHDQAFAADWDAALAEADARLKSGPPADLDSFELVRRGPNGRLQVVAAGKGRWNGRIEARFLAELRRTGNISASARAVRFTPETIWERRRKWPGFAQAMDAVLEEAEIELEFRLARHSNDVVPVRGESGEAEMGTIPEVGTVPCEPIPPFNPEFALKFLKWRDERRAGRGRRGRGDRYRKEPSIEEVRDEIVRRVAAIRRHRELHAGDGAGGDGADGAAGDSPELPFP